MSRLDDVRDEQFAKLLSIGTKAVDAYEKAGFRRDSSNAAKRAKLPRIAARVAELRDEAEAANAPLGELSGIGHLKAVLQGATKAGSWSAAAQAATRLAQADGTLEESEKAGKPMTVGAMLALADEINPSGALRAVVEFCLMLRDVDLEVMPPWEDAAGRPVPPYIDTSTGRLVE